MNQPIKSAQREAVDSCRRWLLRSLEDLRLIDTTFSMVSVTILGIWEQMAIEECQNISLMSMVYYDHFPCFAELDNSLPMFLVTCQIVPISRKSTELLHDWAISTNGNNIYYCLLKNLKDALRQDELMLSLCALAVFHSMRRGTEHDYKKHPEHVQLMDVNRLLAQGIPCPNDGAVIRQMLWSFFYAAKVPPRHAYLYYIKIMNTAFAVVDIALAAVDTVEQHDHEILEHYWIKRLRDSLSNADAMALLLAES
ncbi:MAG: hypothetical protein Q9167_005770 [Letrouitia subvulpina]